MDWIKKFRVIIEENPKEIQEIENALQVIHQELKKKEAKKKDEEEVRKFEFQFKRDENIGDQDKKLYIFLRSGIGHSEAMAILDKYNFDLIDNLNQFCLDFKIKKKTVLQILKDFEDLASKGKRYVEIVRQTEKARYAKSKKELTAEEKELLKV